MNAFKDNDEIIWKQSTNINVGDIIYLYVTEPISAIIFKCEVTETDIPYNYNNDNLSISKFIKQYDNDNYTYSYLNELGIKAIRGPRKIPNKLSILLNK